MDQREEVLRGNIRGKGMRKKAGASAVATLGRAAGKERKKGRGKARRNFPTVL